MSIQLIVKCVYNIINWHFHLTNSYRTTNRHLSMFSRHSQRYQKVESNIPEKEKTKTTLKKKKKTNKW